VKTLPGALVHRTEQSVDLELEAVITRRLRRRVDLQVLRNGVHIRAKRLDERAIGQLSRQDASRQQNDPKRFHTRLFSGPRGSCGSLP
jgi:hypothetical protein